MKHRYLLIFLAAISILLFSCNKEKTPSLKIDPTLEIDPIQNEEIAVSKGMQEGFVLRVNAGFYLIDNDTGAISDKTRWAAGMSLGERVYFGEIRRATFQGDGKEYDYVEIRRSNGSEGYASYLHIAAAGSLAVVVDERASLFRTPRAVDVSSIILSRRSVVVYYPETQIDGYVEVKAYDPVRQAYIQENNCYIRFSSLSIKEQDIQSSILLQTALPLRNEGQDKIRREALLESALLNYIDSVFFSEIYEIAYPAARNNQVQTQPVDFAANTMAVTHDNVNVRDYPSTNGRVTGSVNAGTYVNAIERTAERFNVNGMNNYWYKVTNGQISGWVFGEYLKPLDIQVDTTAR